MTRQCYEAMIQEVAGHLAPFADRHGDELCDMHLLGTSGTVTTVAGVHLGLMHYDRRKVDGLWMNDAEMN